MFYGKHFQSMYTGSMVGAGCAVFAVWGYVIANMESDREVGMQVELNPKLLAFILGGDEEEIERAIEKLCSPDPNSRTEDEGGRRLIRIGQFDYRVVNGKKYKGIVSEELRREGNRVRQARFRVKTKKAETAGEKAEGERSEEELEADRELRRVLTDGPLPGEEGYRG